MRLLSGRDVAGNCPKRDGISTDRCVAERGGRPGARKSGGPAKENVALAVFVVTLIVPVPITVKPAASVPCCESGFVIVRFRAPADALLAIAILATICDGVRELYVFTVMPVPPNNRTATGSKLLPITVKFGRVWPWVPELGEIEVMDGGPEAGFAAGLLRKTDTKLPPAAAISCRPSPSRSAVVIAEVPPSLSM